MPYAHTHIQCLTNDMKSKQEEEIRLTAQSAAEAQSDVGYESLDPG